MHNFTEYNDAQKSAISHYLGPAMILAGPGSGKTTVIVGRIRHLIEHYAVNPSSILVITYTKAAALSMQQRFIREMKGQVLPVVFGTFHAVFYQIIKEHSHFSTDSLLSHDEKYQLIKSLYHKENLTNETIEMILMCISLFKNGFLLEQIPLPMGMEKQVFEKIYAEYCSRSLAFGKLDYDDMLLHCKELLNSSDYILSRWQKRFQYILVDEFQDCNLIQFQVAGKLALPENNLFVVGDDDQSIYGFRGASPNIMRLFIKKYPEASNITLEVNYRSRNEIIKAANQVINSNKNRIQKEMVSGIITNRYHSLRAVTLKDFIDIKEERNYIINRIRELYHLFPYEEMAVIFRTNQEAEIFSQSLENEKIPYYFSTGSKSLNDHFIIKDMIAFLQLGIGNRERKYVLTVMNKPDKKISRMNFMSENEELENIIGILRKNGNHIQAGAVSVFYRQIQSLSKLSPFLALSFIRKGIGYEQWLSDYAGENRKVYYNYLAILQDLTKTAGKFDRIEDFLDYLLHSIEKKHIGTDHRQGGVALLTLHGSKGLEFSYVCIPNVNEGNIPHGKIPLLETEEEERRLFYVGMTRAKTALDILYRKSTKEHPRLPSRFLKSLLTDSYSVSSESSDSSVSSTNSSNSWSSRNSSKASETISYSSSSDI